MNNFCENVLKCMTVDCLFESILKGNFSIKQSKSEIINYIITDERAKVLEENKVLTTIKIENNLNLNLYIWSHKTDDKISMFEIEFQNNSLNIAHLKRVSDIFQICDYGKSELKFIELKKNMPIAGVGITGIEIVELNENEIFFSPLVEARLNYGELVSKDLYKISLENSFPDIIYML